MAEDFQIAKADYYFDADDRSKLALSGEHLLVSKGGIVFEPVLSIYGFVDGVPAGVTLPEETVEPETIATVVAEPEMERRPRFIFPHFERGDDG